jgi:hypothetical protein
MRGERGNPESTRVKGHFVGVESARSSQLTWGTVDGMESFKAVDMIMALHRDSPVLLVSRYNNSLRTIPSLSAPHRALQWPDAQEQYPNDSHATNET